MSPEKAIVMVVGATVVAVEVAVGIVVAAGARAEVDVGPAAATVAGVVGPVSWARVDAQDAAAAASRPTAVIRPNRLAGPGRTQDAARSGVVGAP
jgi:hypothetical protein